MTVQPEPADRLNELLDGDPPVQEPGFSEPVAPELAEQLFAAGVLKHLLAADEGHLDRQVGRSLATLAMSEQRSHLRRSLAWAITAAAVVLIVFVVATQRPEDLMATVDRVIDVAQRDIDREFVVRVLPDENALLADQPEGKLIVRGSPKFVAMIPASRLERLRSLSLPMVETWLGTKGDLWLGTDGEEFWIAPERMQVMRHRNPDRMREFADLWKVMTEAFRLPNLLKLLRTDYDVALTNDSTEPRALIDFTARRRDPLDSLAPEFIRVVADRRSGELHKLVITFGPDRLPMSPWVVYFKLVSREPKPAGFYGADYPRR